MATKKKSPRIKICDGCFVVFASKPPAYTCPYCGKDNGKRIEEKGKRDGSKQE